MLKSCDSRDSRLAFYFWQLYLGFKYHKHSWRLSGWTKCDGISLFSAIIQNANENKSGHTLF